MEAAERLQLLYKCGKVYYYDCPLEFLAMAPVASRAWRDGVLEFHKQRTT